MLRSSTRRGCNSKRKGSTWVDGNSAARSNRKCTRARPPLSQNSVCWGLQQLTRLGTTRFSPRTKRWIPHGPHESSRRIRSSSDSQPRAGEWGSSANRVRVRAGADGRRCHTRPQRPLRPSSTRRPAAPGLVRRESVAACSSHSSCSSASASSPSEPPSAIGTTTEYSGG